MQRPKRTGIHGHMGELTPKNRARPALADPECGISPAVHTLVPPSW